MVSFAGATATLSQDPQNDGLYSRCVIERLDGNGIYLIKQQTGVNLTFFDPPEITESNVECFVYQLAKSPFVSDTHSKNNVLYKFVSEVIKQAVAYQYLFVEKNPNSGSTNYPVKSYSVNAENYSETRDTLTPTSILDRISPIAYEIIQPLTIQTV